MQDHSPLVSILMPCYNAEETLEESLASITNQTLSDFEIVTVDDGSTDSTVTTLTEWSRRERRLKVYTQHHQGIVKTLAAGLELCKAPYIARMDADDRAHPERLERQVNYLNDHSEVALVACRVAGFPPHQVRQGFSVYLDWQNALMTDEEIRREIFVESPIAHPSVTIRRTWLTKVAGYQDFGWAEDYDLWLRLYLAGAKFAKLPEVLLEWRERPQRLTRTDSRYSLENFLRAKAFYLAKGPLVDREAVIIWGAGMMGRRLCKQLQRHNVPLVAFIDIDPRKIGRTRRGLPVIPAESLPEWWNRYRKPILLAAVGARGARALIRQRLSEMGFTEGLDWWSTA